MLHVHCSCGGRGLKVWTEGWVLVCTMCFSCVHIVCHVDTMGETLEVGEIKAKKK